VRNNEALDCACHDR